ncbi:MAG: restriction endonuclease [Planctomycetes bacterium]|nr:restriction endonuclease [Planctomycetota bacterium]
MEPQKLFELAQLDALGLLDDAERSEFDAAFAAAPVNLQVQVRLVQQRVLVPFDSLPDVAPPSDLRNRVIEAIEKVIAAQADERGTSKDAKSGAEVRVYTLSRDLLRAIELDPSKLHFITPAQFEEWIADRLFKMGYDVYLTGKVHTPDGGVDLIARPRNLALSGLLAVQVKHRRGGADSVGPDVVERLASFQNSTFSMGLVATNARFTNQAKWVAATRTKLFMRLREYSHLASWAKLNFSDELALPDLPTEVELRPGFVVRLDDPRWRFTPPS